MVKGSDTAQVNDFGADALGFQRFGGGQGHIITTPNLYIAMGQTAENVVEAEGITREEMDRMLGRTFGAGMPLPMTAAWGRRSAVAAGGGGWSMSVNIG